MRIKMNGKYDFLLNNNFFLVKVAKLKKKKGLLYGK